MKKQFENITVNGQPLNLFFAIHEAVEAEKARRAEVADVTFSKPAPRSKHRRNASGSRSGRVRIIYSASDSRWTGTTPEQALLLDKLAKLGVSRG